MSDFIIELGLTLSLAILVGVGAGRIIHTLNIFNMEPEITHLAVDVIKGQIVEKLDILLRVYRDTNVNGNLPEAVDVQAVSERVLFSVDSIDRLNYIYVCLVDHGIQSEAFQQVISF